MATERAENSRQKRTLPQKMNPPWYAAQGYGRSRDLEGLGTGDSRLVFDILSTTTPIAEQHNTDGGNKTSENGQAESESDRAFKLIFDEVKWDHMRNRGIAVKRMVAQQGAMFTSELSGMTCEPLYRHPADETPALSPFSPFVDEIRRTTEERLGVSLNHALIQLYRNGRDHISEHADKTLDIRRGTPVVNVSFGATRDMHIRDKRTRRKELLTRKKQYRKQRVSLVHNSAFVLGWQTNMELTHAIPLDKRRESEKRADEVLCGGERISITFRDVATFLREDGAVFGQGGVAKCESELKAAIGQAQSECKIEVDADTETLHASIGGSDAAVAESLLASQRSLETSCFDSSCSKSTGCNASEITEPSKVNDTGIIRVASENQDPDTTHGKLGIQTQISKFSEAINTAAKVDVTAHDDVDVERVEELEKAEMLRRFGEENASSNFDWEELYGRGFNILNTKLAQRRFSQKERPQRLARR